MKRISLIKLVGLIAMAISLPSAGLSQELKVGSNAPELKVSSWVKGKPIKAFESGKTYVVEFWATWCGPCRETIPHLTELAKKFKDKVTFIGVNSFEQPADNLKEVKKFVESMGSKMDYPVAVDGTDQAMAKNWMTASEQQGIPTAFVVDGAGKIAWIGHPMEIEPILEKVVAGTYDTKAAAQVADEKSKKEASLNAHMAKVRELVDSGDFKGAVVELDATIKESPEVEAGLGPIKFEYMARLGDSGTNEYAKYLSEGPIKDMAMALNNVAWYLVDDDVNYKGADYALAVKIAKRATELTKEIDPTILDSLGYALFKNKEVDEAIKIQAKAVALAETDKTMDEQTKTELRERLEKFKKAKKG